MTGTAADPRAPEDGPAAAPGEFLAYMQDCRELVLEELRTFVPPDGPLRPVLYDLIFDYPLRAAKALRPALCLATCRALGGGQEAVLRSAAVLELYHNAFLVHDDVEDGSELRRSQPTLHRIHGVPIAINVGDAMLALALRPLLENMRLLGLGRALGILQAVAEMAQQTVEGQAIELAWIRDQRWDLPDRAYLQMVHKKTTWYTFLTPMKLGAIAAGADDVTTGRLLRIAVLVGIAFQIQDDVLNLVGDEAVYGKERDGDLWEGKHTLVLMHSLRAATAGERARALAILAKGRPTGSPREGAGEALREELERLRAAGEIGESAFRRLGEILGQRAGAHPVKTAEEVAFLRHLVDRRGGIAHARAVAARHARRARRALDRLAGGLPDSSHLRFLQTLVDFTLDRNH